MVNHSSGAIGKLWTKVSIPSAIQNGDSDPNKGPRCDFRGEAIVDGDLSYARIVGKDVSMQDGSDVNRVERRIQPTAVVDGTLAVAIGNMNQFTMIEFMLAPVEGKTAR